MIKLLDKTTIDKIAAGEVIERPSSVVKELVENSIDAGAASVTVEIKEGGISFIRVTDNGYGIPKDEIRTAYLRHATSKIENAGDLDSIETLGFRGEALATIAAVSQTEMVTKTVESLTGVKYVIHGGDEVEFKEVGVPDGTTIVVRNLFYNTPARKKFLKTSMTEGSYITDLMTKIALSHPDISIKLIINGQSKISTTGNGNVRDVIYQLYGKDITAALLEVSYTSGDINITGYVAKPYICRGNRGLENYFINNRYIRNNIINRAIEEGYRTYVMQHKFPFAVLFFELPYDSCDVNVHPTKMEFKYENEKELFEATLAAVKSALDKKELIPPAKDSGRADWGTVKAEKSIEKGAEPFEVNRGIPKPSYNAVNYSKSYSMLQTLKNQEQKEKQIDDGIGNQSRLIEELSGAKQNDGASEQIPEVDKADVKVDVIVDVIEERNKSDQATVTYSSAENSDGFKKLPPDNDDAQGIVKEGEEVTEKTETPPQKHLYNTNGVYTTTRPLAEDELPEHLKSAFRDVKGVQLSIFNDEILPEKEKLKYKLIGQLFDTYWLIEYDRNLYIMDQHAAHEKIKYERLMADFKNKEILSQQLMPPLIITVTYQERETVLEYYDLFMKTGYDIEEFGGNEFKINAVPSNLYGIPEKTLFMEFVASLMENTGYVSNDIFIRKLSTMACKSAIKGNTHITYQEADNLVKQLLELENPYTCPHGRPTIISMSEAEIEKKFRRIV